MPSATVHRIPVTTRSPCVDSTGTDVPPRLLLRGHHNIHDDPNDQDNQAHDKAGLLSRCTQPCHSSLIAHLQLLTLRGSAFAHSAQMGYTLSEKYPISRNGHNRILGFTLWTNESDPDTTIGQGKFFWRVVFRELSTTRIADDNPGFLQRGYIAFLASDGRCTPPTLWGPGHGITPSALDA